MTSVLKMDLIGLDVEVVKARNLSLVGCRGRVVDETKNTIIIMCDGVSKTLIKDQVWISLEYRKKKIRIDGKKLNKRPEDRIR